MKIKTQLQCGIMALMISLFVSSCKDKDPSPGKPPENENELITTMVIEFEDSFLFKKHYVVFRDLDGEGGNPPSQFDTIKLTNTRPYITRIILLDESKPVKDTVSNQVLKEKNDHLFIYTPSGVNITVKPEDRDDNNLPVGLFTIWRTGAPAIGKMNIRLKHQPGVKDGTAGPGDTDVELNFNCLIE